MKRPNIAQALLIAIGVSHQVVLLGHHKTYTQQSTKKGPGRRHCGDFGTDRRKDKLRETLIDGEAHYVEFWPPESKLQRAIRLHRLGVSNV